MQDSSGREKALQVVVMIRLWWLICSPCVVFPGWQARGEVPGPHKDWIVSGGFKTPELDEMAMACEGKGHRKGHHKREGGREDEREGRCWS